MFYMIHCHRRVRRDSSPYHAHESDSRHGMGGSRQLGVQIDSNTFQLGRRGSGGSVMASAHGSGSGSDAGRMRGGGHDSDMVGWSRPRRFVLYRDWNEVINASFQKWIHFRFNNYKHTPFQEMDPFFAKNIIKHTVS